MRSRKTVGTGLFMLLILTAGYLSAQVTWAPLNAAHDSIPPNTIVAGKKHGVRLYVCRARLAVGVSPGESTGSICIVPYLGKAEVFREFELATSLHYSWHPDRWENAVVGGRQHGNANLYLCRARVIKDAIDYGFIPGKAFRFGPHTNHCYIPFHGKDLDFKGHFELLHTSLKRH
jgi:DM9 repeat